MWFINEWFFKWHFIGKDGPVSIDSFDGRGIRLGGIKFSGSARNVYWDVVVRGVRKEITEQFVWIDQEVRNYNRETALQAIDECAAQLTSWVGTIRREAVTKDRILRGDGSHFPKENDAGHWDGTSEREINSQAEALKIALPKVIDHAHIPPSIDEPTLRTRASTYWHNNQWWLGPLGLLVGIVGLLPLLL